MVWFRFDKDFDFSPSTMNGRVTIAYKTGMIRSITREAADRAEACEAGKRTAQPRKPENPD